MTLPSPLVVNCGASRVAVGLFQNRSGQLVLEKYVSQELDYDFSQEEDWLPAVTRALRRITSEHKLAGKCSAIIPGYLLLTKPTKIPHVEESRRAQVIAYEAQQSIPYPLGDVVWGSQVIADDGVETEVVFLAVKQDMADRFCAALAESGFPPVSVQSASILDINAFRLSQGDADEGTLLLNVGARSSNLLFINKEGFFVRNIALGGNSLTQNIADSLGKSFSEAEAVKVRYFSGSTSFDSEDQAVQLLEQNKESFLKRLGQEVTRSVVTYRRQRGAPAPSRILLAGRASRLPGLSEHLNKTQKMEVAVFDPTAGIQTGDGVDTSDETKAQIGELVGEAARGVLSNPASIDLLPERLQRQMAFAKKKPLLVAAFLLLALAPIPPLLYFMDRAAIFETAAEELQPRAQPLRSLSSRIQQTREQVETVREDILSLQSLANTRSNWINFFADLQQRLQNAGDVWLENLNVSREEGLRLRLSGRLLIREADPETSFAVEQAEERVNSLLESFSNSGFISEVGNIQLTVTDPRILRFDFTLAINPDKPL